MWGIRKAERDEEFTAFLREATPSLGRTAWLLTGDRTLAADLVQESLVRTYAAWSRVRREDALAYTRRTLVNTHISSWRRRHGEVVAELPERATDSHEGGVADRDEVAHLLAVLPAQQRAVLALRYVEDLSEADIARTLAIPPGTVKSAASRGLAALRTHLSAPSAVPAPEGSPR